MKNQLLTKLLKKAQQGFTMVEIMIGLVIIALFVTLMFVNYSGQGEKAKAVTGLTALNQTQGNIDRFVQDYGAVPAEWGTAASGAGVILDAAATQTLFESIGGVYATAGSLKNLSQKYPTMQLNDTPANIASHYRIAIINPSGIKRVIVLQYRRSPDDPFAVNFNKTTSAALVTAAAIADATVLPSTFLGSTDAWAW